MVGSGLREIMKLGRGSKTFLFQLDWFLWQSRSGWAPALVGLSIMKINVIKRICPTCFSFPYLPTCHSESFPIMRKHRALSYTATQYWVSQPLELWVWITLLIYEWSTFKFSVMGQRRGWDHSQPHPSSETLIALPVTVQSGWCSPRLVEDSYRF